MPDAIPDIHKYRGYSIYFWSNENNPLEPVHVHISKGKPNANSTKYWINNDGTIELENNNSEIPLKDLQKIEKLIKGKVKDIINTWENYFKEPAKFHNSIRDNYSDR